MTIHNPSIMKHIPPSFCVGELPVSPTPEDMGKIGDHRFTQSNTTIRRRREEEEITSQATYISH